MCRRGFIFAPPSGTDRRPARHVAASPEARQLLDVVRTGLGDQVDAALRYAEVGELRAVQARELKDARSCVGKDDACRSIAFKFNAGLTGWLLAHFGS